jgi:hypothetical protein
MLLHGIPVLWIPRKQKAEGVDSKPGERPFCHVGAIRLALLGVYALIFPRECARFGRDGFLRDSVLEDTLLGPSLSGKLHFSAMNSSEWPAEGGANLPEDKPSTFF